MYDIIWMILIRRIAGLPLQQLDSICNIKGVRRNMERGFQTWNEMQLIIIHDIHMSIHRFHCKLVEYYSHGALAQNHRAKLRPKVLIFHTDTCTWINARTIILNLILSGSESLMISIEEYEHVLLQWVIVCAYLAVYKRDLLRTSMYVMCKSWIRTIHGLPCANCGSTLCETQSQVQRTKREGRSRREESRSVTKGDVKHSYLGLRIRLCSLRVKREPCA